MFKFQRFQLGKTVATQSISQAKTKDKGFAAFLNECFVRHARADFGIVCKEDEQVNEDAIREGNQILSSYSFPPTLYGKELDYSGRSFKTVDSESRLWIITDAVALSGQRETTTALYPSEY